MRGVSSAQRGSSNSQAPEARTLCHSSSAGGLVETNFGDVDKSVSRFGICQSFSYYQGFVVELVVLCCMGIHLVYDVVFRTCPQPSCNDQSVLLTHHDFWCVQSITLPTLPGHCYRNTVFRGSTRARSCKPCKTPANTKPSNSEHSPKTAEHPRKNAITLY